MTSSTTIANSSVLITGANRGLGRALVEEALRGARGGCMPRPVGRMSTPTAASSR